MFSVEDTINDIVNEININRFEYICDEVYNRVISNRITFETAFLKLMNISKK